MSENQKYIIIQLSEAKQIYELLNKYVPKNELDNHSKMMKRFEDEEGADIEDIAWQLKKLDICFPCKMEGQEKTCESLEANKLGRRLYRLILRANYEWPES